MTPKDTFAAYCTELLGPLGAVRSKRMFGGHGLYVDDVFIAIVHGTTLYLKADPQTRERFAAAGCNEFTYSSAGRTRSLGYWSAPEAAMDSPPAMRPWAGLALEAALRSRGS